MSRRTQLALLTFMLSAGAFVSLCGVVSRAEAAPAFRWPWAGTDGWRYTQGFHVDYALDFQPQIAANCGDPVDLTHTIRPVAPGTVTQVRLRGSPQPAIPTGLLIDHGGGWSSSYTHLANIPASVATVGAQVTFETDLGNPSCYTECPGSGVGPPCATGRHIHFQIKRDGAGSGILQATICGWTVGADSGLTRNGVTYYPSKSGAAPIANAFCPAGDPPTPRPTSTPTPTPTAEPSATFPPQYLRGDASCDGRVSATDAAIVLQHSVGLEIVLCSPQAADANSDGAVNPIDAQLVLQFSARVIDVLWS